MAAVQDWPAPALLPGVPGPPRRRARPDRHRLAVVTGEQRWRRRQQRWYLLRPLLLLGAVGGAVGAVISYWTWDGDE